MIDDGVQIRPARREDAPAVAAMANQLRLWLGDPLDHFGVEAILRDGFGDRPEFDLLVADRQGELVGYALFADTYEPAFAARGVYLADLYVAASARGAGIGRRLVQAVETATRARNRGFIWWVALPTNETALAFYQRLKPDMRSTIVEHVLLLK